MTTKPIYQHYQTCHDVQCPLFNDQEPAKGCSALREGECEYEVVHILQGTEINQQLNDKWHGLYREWHNDGQLNYECNFINGELDGFIREWHYVFALLTTE